MNNVSILGNLATAPKSSILSSGTVKASALVAIKEHYIDSQGNAQSRVVFVWIEAFGKLAINFSKYCVLGQQVALSGRLAGGNKEINRQWRNCTAVQASEIQFLAKPKVPNRAEVELSC
jgi:single-stranded DNA-binding protein